MLAQEHVTGGGRVTAVRALPEIFLGQAEVSLVGDLVGVAGLQAQALVERLGRVGIELQFDEVVLDVVAGRSHVDAGGSVDDFEAVVLGLHGLGEPRESFAAIADVDVGVDGLVLA